MVYLPLRNWRYDSGPRRIQSGPAHEGYTVVSSGVTDTGADEGVVTEGYPNFYSVSSDTSWRYSPYTASGSILDVGSTAYNPSGQLSTYTAYRPLTKATAAGSNVATSIGPDYGLLDNGRYVTLGGLSPSSQVYTPYNTPATNSAAEGYTGGPVSHRSFENGMLVNILGSQGTSDRSQWRYSQPVYCKTYTETIRPDSPGLMSTAVRYIYRGESTRYSLNAGNVMTYATPRVDYDTSLSFPSGSPLIYAPWTAPVVEGATDYVWFADGKSISGANSSTYTPTIDQLGKRIYVNVSTGSNNVVTSKSYVSVIGYRYYLGQTVDNMTLKVYRKLSGIVSSCPGPTPDPDFNPLVSTLTITTPDGSASWDNVVVSVGSGFGVITPDNDYTLLRTSSCPFGDYFNLRVFVDTYLGASLVSSNTTDFLVDASFKQSAHRLTCALMSVTDTTTGERVEYTGVDLV